MSANAWRDEITLRPVIGLHLVLEDDDHWVELTAEQARQLRNQLSRALGLIENAAE